jgi:periplasmic protein CpxP/Spy
MVLSRKSLGQSIESVIRQLLSEQGGDITTRSRRVRSDRQGSIKHFVAAATFHVARVFTSTVPTEPERRSVKMSKVPGRAVWILAGVIGLSGLALAQEAAPQADAPQAPPARMAHGHGMNDNADGRLQHLSRELNLTDDQKAKLKPILKSEWQEMKPVHDDTALSREQKHEKMKGIHEKYQAQVEGVLTPEQQEKWKKMQKERMERHEKMEKGPAEAPKN